MLRKAIVLDMKMEQKEVDALINERCSADPIIPEFVEEKEVKNPDAYNRFRDLDLKEKFREKMLKAFHASLLGTYDDVEAKQLVSKFIDLAKEVEMNGAIIFGDLIDKSSFQELIKMYSGKLTDDGSKSWIHSYINFGNHPDFLTHERFRNAFIHPLLIALIAYAAGGPFGLWMHAEKTLNHLQCKLKIICCILTTRHFVKNLKLF